MSERMISLLAACAVTAAGLAIAAPAVAQETTPVVTATILDEDIPVRYVSYRDLNLAMAGGEQALVKRVGYAVKDVCEESQAGGLLLRTGETTCRSQSWDRARPQINRAVQRAREIAANGWSSIAPVAITISVE